MKAACLSEREDALNPAVSLVAFGALASLAPEHREPDHALAKVVGRLHSLFCQEKKECVHFCFESARKRARFALAVPIKGDKMTKPCKKCPPLSDGRWGFGHLYEALQLLCSPLAAAREFRIGSLRQGAGLANKMRQAGLSFVYPFSVNAVVVADQNAAPEADELFKCLLGPIGMDHKEGNHGIGHHPKPVELAALVPGRLVDMVYPRCPGFVPYGFVM